ncbi:MAG: SGNH/GDSL hydrolase family protein [Ginsengibacter sp.]
MSCRKKISFHCQNAFIVFFFFLVTFYLLPNSSIGQQTQKKWLDPLKDSVAVIEGQVSGEKFENPYERLPMDFRSDLNGKIWNESRQSVGLLIRFQTNANEIEIKYTVDNKTKATDLPETAVSGIDLYAVDADGKFYWCNGKYQFGDTITYSFPNLKPNDKYHPTGREYRLYLPLFASVRSLKIGVSPVSDFTFLKSRLDKPVVIYGGASIQGASATRPGLTWSNILGRKLDRPIINLGFASNPRLNKKITSVLTGIDAQIYILASPQAGTYSSATEAKDELIKAVEQIKEKKPEIPVLLAATGFHIDDYLNNQHNYEDSLSNAILQDAYDDLKKDGVNNLYLLDKNGINFNINSFAGSTGLNDIGMQQYANAVEKIIRKVLHEPTGTASTTHPRTQKRDANLYNWEIRHRYILNRVKQNQPKVIFIGNSITHYWGGLPHGPIKSAWDAPNPFFDSLDAEDLGYGWDRIENVLWRIYHGELDGYKARQAVLLIGTNNLDVNTNAEILEGLKFVVNAIKIHQPGCKILMLGLTPRRGYENRIAELNRGMAKLAGLMNVNYADAGGLFLKADGKIDESLFSDGLHPTAKGYKMFENFLWPYLNKNHEVK